MLKIKKMLALVICFVMMISIFPVSAFAESGNEIQKFVSGEDITLSLCDYEYYMAERIVEVDATQKYQISVDSPYAVDIFMAEFKDGQVDYMSDFWVFEIFESGKGNVYANLEAGKSYYLTISSMDKQQGFSVNVSLKQAPTVKKVEIANLPYNTFYYETDISNIEISDLQLNVTLSDGQTDTIYLGDGGYNIDYHVQLDKTKKDFGKVTVTVDGCSVSFMLEIKENPVSKIEYVGKPIEIVEKTNGYQDEEIFYYNYIDYFEGQVFKVTFKDGKVGYYDCFEALEGFYMIEVIDDQYDKPWKVGNKNYINVEYAGVKTKIPVTISKSPVKKIVIDKAPSYVYTYGDLNDGTFDGEDYSFDPTHYEDLEFTAIMTDGSKRSYTGEDIDAVTNTLDGKYFSFDYDFEDVWPGEHEVEFNFNGKKASYKVTLKESDVQSVKLVKGVGKTKYDVGFIPDFVGCEFKITLKNGKTKTLKLTKDNVYYLGTEAYIIENKKAVAAIFADDTEENKMTFTLYYYGKSCKIVDAVYENQPLYTSVAFENITDSLKNIKLLATTADGKTDTYILKNNYVEKYMDLIDTKIDLSMILSLFNIGVYYVPTDRGVFSAYVIFVNEGGIPSEYIAEAFELLAEGKINENAVLNKISVDQKPSKVKYFKGEEFDPKGLVITAEYEKGLKGNLVYGVDEGIEISKVNTSKPGKKTVTVSYNGKKTTFEIEVTEGFSDVKKGTWYEQYVNFAYSYGIFEGTDKTKNTFSPNMTMTRAQIVQILANIDGINTQNNNVSSGFKDVEKSQWYTAAVKWAAENGIVSGTGDGNFKPNDAVTREQLCVMVTNYVEEYYGGILSKEVAKTEFSDDKNISSWAKDAVYTCQRAGIISGKGNGKFAPKDTATRAEGATIFAEFTKKYMF